MNPFAELPTWLALVVALLAAVVLIALNLGWLMAAKAMLDGQRKKSQERRAGMAPPPGMAPSPKTESGRMDQGGPTDRTPII